jgi:hypothetical protein
MWVAGATGWARMRSCVPEEAGMVEGWSPEEAGMRRATPGEARMMEG